MWHRLPPLIMCFVSDKLLTWLGPYLLSNGNWWLGRLKSEKYLLTSNAVWWFYPFHPVFIIEIGLRQIRKYKGCFPQWGILVEPWNKCKFLIQRRFIWVWNLIHDQFQGIMSKNNDPINSLLIYFSVLVVLFVEILWGGYPVTYL